LGRGQEFAGFDWRHNALKFRSTDRRGILLSLPFAQHLTQHRELFARLDAMAPDVTRAAACMSDALRSGGKLMFCGNGGSAADSQHLASEFTGRFVDDRRPLAALALSTDSSALTCIANDYAFDQVFERQLRGLGRKGDLLVAISTSGRSGNVLHAVQAARETGIAVVGLLGRDGGTLKPLCDVALVVPSDTTARIQEAHIFIGHTLCAMVEQALGL
jgi:D-sedoheptulose 7-phosphate isomerase